MDVRKKNTYEVLDMIEKNLISESDIIYYIENGYLDNQLLEDVMDTMFSEASIKELNDKISDLSNDVKSHQEVLKSLPYPDRALYMKHNFAPVLKEKYKLTKELVRKNEEIRSAERNLEAAKEGHSLGYGSAADVEEAQKRLDSIKSKHNGVETPKQTETKVETTKSAEPVKHEPVKTEAPKQVETKTEAPKQTETGHTETPKTSNDEHADGIWEKIKGGYHTIKKAAGEHLETAKKYAMEHPGIAGAAAAGAAVAGLAAYAGYKHLKNKKALASAHEDAHKAAMDSISKTHGHLSGAAAAHIHNDIHNVINSNREMFKKDPRKSKEQLVNHFGSDEYKKHLISKLSK